ncbi:MAG TPA: GTP pyrophosphokinase family protein [Limnochordia bacterium]|nr:GTP pyrophosphokinase family protein [Bacillota bacterium]HOB08213.1 GTP pyrophosphokinase family protein [Limnochordia bacterium]NLH31048.1 GTP pyrophosphokinase family protein [Bacillota bacterium]HPT92282.1 GTP pyrophosphokinase family protein [Limnochordia bacterium]HPZ30340.1 GTP pyrophosphokinase family protein [Limnochordia bacterium]
MDACQLERLKQEIIRFMMVYKFAIEELTTRIEILKQESEYLHGYNPIDHVTSRLKSPESILQKACRKGVPLSLPAIKENIRDIAGLRIICPFVSDIYKVGEMLRNHSDLEIAECKDYIQHPKPSGYRSLHLIVQVPVATSGRIEKVWAEIQMRTIAMDFWASLEHKLNYKYNYQIPEPLLNELREAAESIAVLDARMEKINREVNHFKASHKGESPLEELWINNQRFHVPKAFLNMLKEQDHSPKKD